MSKKNAWVVSGFTLYFLKTPVFEFYKGRLETELMIYYIFVILCLVIAPWVVYLSDKKKKAE